jgi:TolB-like protein
LPDKPSIAVLPFNNMSDDPEQEFFADGITEGIITELARYPSLFVIARNSTFTYKGQSVRIQDVDRKQGVRYLVEGSVRKAGNRVRVTVQLIETAGENHIWAERYDRELSDIFEIQDELTRAIVGRCPPVSRRRISNGSSESRRKIWRHMTTCYAAKPSTMSARRRLNPKRLML